MLDVLAACRHLFERGIVHRDLKSSNVLLTKAGRAKLADFGFAVSQEKVQEKQAYNVGSPMYMPPETLLNNQYSFKTDIFSLGVIFYEILYGEAPWESRTQAELIEKLLTKPIDFSGRTLQPETQDFIVSALQIDPKSRLAPEDYSRQIQHLSKALRRLSPQQAQNVALPQLQPQVQAQALSQPQTQTQAQAQPQPAQS